jgi:hypothetical protein
MLTGGFFIVAPASVSDPISFEKGNNVIAEAAALGVCNAAGVPQQIHGASERGISSHCLNAF